MKITRIIAVICAVVTIGIALSYNALTTQADTKQYNPIPLKDVDDETISVSALKHLKAWDAVLNVETKPALVQTVTANDLASLGLGDYPSFAHKSLVLVIFKGDFNLNKFPGSRGPEAKDRKAKYVAEVLDLDTGDVLLTMSSPNGGAFRKALNDPNLPEDIEQ
jgi:hypothetical protein